MPVVVVVLLHCVCTVCVGSVSGVSAYFPLPLTSIPVRMALDVLV